MIRSAVTVMVWCSAVAVAQQEPVERRIARAVASVEPARIEATVRALAGFGTRHVLSTTDDDARGTGAARRWLREQYEALVERSGGRLQVELQATSAAVRRQGMPDEVPLVNVVATLPGETDPGRVYVVSGHYDSRNSDGADGAGLAPGANDDASGTAVALEVCRVLCEQRLAATILFCAYDGEEQGLLGSAAHAEALKAAEAGVDGMITCDIVGNTLGMDGRRREGYVRCFSYAPSGNDSLGRSMARAVRRGGDHVEGFEVKLVFRGDRYGRGGDHRSFYQQGYPAVRMTEPREDYSRQHQDLTERAGKPYGDVPEYVDFDFAANVARVVAATLIELAAAPPPPLVQGASGARDAYDTLLRFAPPAGVEDFEFVWRETTAPDWQGVIARESAAVSPWRERWLEARLPGLCLDDLVVGVRSVGPDGARSRVATPAEPDSFSTAQRQRQRSEGR